MIIQRQCTIFGTEITATWYGEDDSVPVFSVPGDPGDKEWSILNILNNNTGFNVTPDNLGGEIANLEQTGYGEVLSEYIRKAYADAEELIAAIRSDPIGFTTYTASSVVHEYARSLI